MSYAAEFKKMADDFMEDEELTSSECEKFMKYVDEDGDGVLTPDEVANFIERGLSISEDARQEYRRKSAIHKKLLDFVLGAHIEMT